MGTRAQELWAQLVQLEALAGDGVGPAVGGGGKKEGLQGSVIISAAAFPAGPALSLFLPARCPFVQQENVGQRASSARACKGSL